MARKRKTYTQRGLLPEVATTAAISTVFAHIERLEAAMSKIARALPHDAALALVWARLVEMHEDAVTEQAKETEAQSSARRWLAAQKEMSFSNTAMSASGNPAP